MAVRQALAFAAVALLLACRQSLPQAPTELSGGIVVYEHADYLGASAHITEDIRDLKDFKGPCQKTESGTSGSTTTDVWTDCISSVRVAPGWWATLYRDDGYDGPRMNATQDIPNLRLVIGDCDKGGFNDCVSSIRIFRE
jgi:hypothetical protein